jgi:hypothetical protein
VYRSEYINAISSKPFVMSSMSPSFYPLRHHQLPNTPSHLTPLFPSSHSLLLPTPTFTTTPCSSQTLQTQPFPPRHPLHRAHTHRYRHKSPSSSHHTHKTPSHRRTRHRTPRSPRSARAPDPWHCTCTARRRSTRRGPLTRARRCTSTCRCCCTGAGRRSWSRRRPRCRRR